MKILAIDPGKTTGVCYADWDLLSIPNDKTPLNVETTKLFEIQWENRFAIGELVALPTDVIVIENFIMYANKHNDLTGAEFPSSQIIGIVEYCAYKLGKLQTLVKMNASTRVRASKPFPFNQMNIDDLIDGSVLIHKITPHTTDAFQHAVTYATKCFFNRKNK